MIPHQARRPTGVGRKSLDKPAVCSSESMPPCPRDGCCGTLSPYPTAQLSYDSVTGLDSLTCRTCGHDGMRVLNGLHLVFGGPNEYVFHYPPSLASLTVAASPAILVRFTEHGFTNESILQFMAKWVPLTGRTIGIVRFTAEKAALEDCYDYFRRHIVQNRSAHTA